MSLTSTVDIMEYQVEMTVNCIVYLIIYFKLILFFLYYKINVKWQGLWENVSMFFYFKGNRSDIVCPTTIVYVVLRRQKW